jgi:hypothetical protein
MISSGAIQYGVPTVVVLCAESTAEATDGHHFLRCKRPLLRCNGRAPIITMQAPIITMQRTGAHYSEAKQSSQRSAHERMSPLTALSECAE